MSTDRLIRINELIRREIGEALFRLLSADDMDLSAVTITRVMTSPDLKHARVFVSIRDHQEERSRMMGLIRSRRIELQERIGRNIFIKFTPRLSFVLDSSIEKGDRVLSILARMEESGPPHEDRQEEETPDS